MKCHYEVLGVGQKATDSELKKAYRKMALLWHPDKNPDNMEEAKIQFQLIQAAYETLSDPQERAFYDRNRESILRGKAVGSDVAPDYLNLFKYFSSQCYSGFSDSEKGFYTIYRQVFETISVMDMKYIDDEEDIVIPNFGNSSTDLEDVAVFYGHWSSYCSSMDFSWADEHDISQAHGIGRWAEKVIEKDNNKARQKARKQFNEEVRALVAFVRKRDKRWIARKKMMEAKIAENAQKQQESQHRRRETRQMMMKENIEQEKANLAAYEDELKAMEEKFADEWGSTESKDSDYSEEDEEKGTEEAESLDDPERTEKEVLLDDLYCIACNKSFKTEKSKESHQRSKKHRENIQMLKATMTLEDKAYFKDFLDSKMVNGDPQSEDVATFPKSTKKKKRKNKKKSVAEEPGYPHSPECVHRKQKCKEKNCQSIDELGVNTISSEEEGEKSREIIDSHDDTSDKAKDVKDEGKCEEDRFDNKELEHQSFELAQNDEDKRTKLKHNSETEKDVSIEVNRKLEGKKAKKQAAQPDVKVNKCTVCGNVYPSKNKLFNHIKAEGHAALKTVTKEVKGKMKSKK